MKKRNFIYAMAGTLLLASLCGMILLIKPSAKTANPEDEAINSHYYFAKIESQERQDYLVVTMDDDTDDLADIPSEDENTTVTDCLLNSAR